MHTTRCGTARIRMVELLIHAKWLCQHPISIPCCWHYDSITFTNPAWVPSQFSSSRPSAVTNTYCSTHRCCSSHRSIDILHICITLGHIYMHLCFLRKLNLPTLRVFHCHLSNPNSHTWFFRTYMLCNNWLECGRWSRWWGWVIGCWRSSSRRLRWGGHGHIWSGTQGTQAS